MILKYCPPERLVIDEDTLEFGEPRGLVRSKVKATSRDDNNVFQMPEAEPIYVHRDIYEGTGSDETFFMLSYDGDDLLSEMEVHNCERIEVMGVSFGFNDDLEGRARVCLNKKAAFRRFFWAMCHM